MHVRGRGEEVSLFGEGVVCVIDSNVKFHSYVIGWYWSTSAHTHTHTHTHTSSHNYTVRGPSFVNLFLLLIKYTIKEVWDPKRNWNKGHDCVFSLSHTTQICTNIHHAGKHKHKTRTHAH